MDFTDGELYTPPPVHLYTMVSLRCSGGGLMRLKGLRHGVV